MAKKPTLTAEQVLQRYTDEYLLDFLEMPLTGVNQAGRFGDMPLHTASIGGLMEEVDALLAAGADVNAKGEKDFTPLHYAATFDHLPVVRRLLERGAITDTRNEFGKTPREIAVQNGRNDIVSAIDDRDKRIALKLGTLGNDRDKND